MSIRKRFLQYVSIDTQADPAAPKTSPSNPGQIELARLLTDELLELGLQAEMDACGYVYGYLPATAAGLLVLGLVAHLDTAPNCSGRDIRPQLIRTYDGGGIKLAGTGETMTPDYFPDLASCIGHDLIVSDGRTLLGGDDKAGIAVIMEVLEMLQAMEEPHGAVAVAFVPDEEIGRSMDGFDRSRFPADLAYTIDAGGMGLLQYENFNASNATVTITGVDTHPGEARGHMVHALNIAHELHGRLPVEERAETTSGRQGFYHLTSIEGSIAGAVLHYAIREHDKARYVDRKETMTRLVEDINREYGDVAAISFEDYYHNMADVLSRDSLAVAAANKAYEACCVTPDTSPLRGYTDGTELSFAGLPCPNLSGGFYNYHTVYEFVSINNMKAMVNVVLEIIRFLAE